MNISEFHDMCDNLGRFASIRERKEPDLKNTKVHKHQPIAITFDIRGGVVQEHRPRLFSCKGCSKLWRAEELNRQYDPSDKVLVQARLGGLKLVAGNVDSTLIVAAGETGADGRALVSARLLLSAAKSLRGRGTVEFDVSPRGATIRVSTGGEISLPNVDVNMPHWARVPATEPVATALFFPGFLTEAARVFGATTGDIWPFSHVGLIGDGERLRLTACDRYSLGSIELPLGGEVSPFGSVSVGFVSAVRYLAVAGDIGLYPAEGVAVVRSGDYTGVTQLYPALAVPSLDDFVGPITFVEVETKVLTDMVRGVANTDAHNRVTLAAKADGLTVHPYNNRDASVRVPALTWGEPSTVGVDAGVLSRCLRAYPGKTVNLGWAPVASPIRFIDKDWPWTMLLAPVVL